MYGQQQQRFSQAATGNAEDSLSAAVTLIGDSHPAKCDGLVVLRPEMARLVRARTTVIRCCWLLVGWYSLAAAAEVTGSLPLLILWIIFSPVGAGAMIGMFLSVPGARALMRPTCIGVSDSGLDVRSRRFCSKLSWEQIVGMQLVSFYPEIRLYLADNRSVQFGLTGYSPEERQLLVQLLTERAALLDRRCWSRGLFARKSLLRVRSDALLAPRSWHRLRLVASRVVQPKCGDHVNNQLVDR